MEVWLIRIRRLGYLSWLDYESKQFGCDHEMGQACLFDSKHAADQAVEALRACGMVTGAVPVAAKLETLFGED